MVSSSQLQWTHHGTQLSPSAKLVVPLGKTYLGKGKMPHSGERSEERSVRNSPASTKISEEGGGGGAPGTAAEIPLQPVMKTMVRHVVPLQSMEDHIRAGIYTAACGGPHTGAETTTKKQEGTAAAITRGLLLGTSRRDEREQRFDHKVPATEKFTSKGYQKDLQQSQKLNPDLKDPSSKQGQYEPGRKIAFFVLEVEQKKGGEEEEREKEKLEKFQYRYLGEETDPHLSTTSFQYKGMSHSDTTMTNEGWRLNHFPGQPVPMLDNPFREVKFPNIQSKPPLVQLEAISSCPITCYLGEETDPHLSTTSFQAKQPQFPQPLLIRLVLQTLHQLRCPSLDSLQHLNVPLVVGGPKLNTVFEVRPHQCRVQGDNHFPTPAGHAISDTSQDAIGFLGRLGTLLAHIQAAVNQHPQVLLCQAAFQPLFPKPVALHGVAVAQVQDPALGLVKPHTIGLGPWIQPVHIPLQNLPTLQQINTPTQLGVICKHIEGALDPFIQIIDKDTKQNWPQHRALGNTACDRPPTGVNSIHHYSLGPAIQPVLYPSKSTPVQAMSSQFLQENAVGNGVKGFTEV
ncbi:hypothetical protein QYF61_022823 [Mycteria americana]|uniref:Uncharacterized protein n=1 Tax=Mycteria americana TaxID=33587 RepID=A0AAN7NMM4_MYCAM|nr:hypothetical protein QYF61_022823 [Mycteria americana]